MHRCEMPRRFCKNDSTLNMVCTCFPHQRAQDAQAALAAAQEERGGLEHIMAALREELARRGEEASAASREIMSSAEGAQEREGRLRQEVTALQTRLENGQRVIDELRAAADRAKGCVCTLPLACGVLCVGNSPVAHGDPCYAGLPADTSVELPQMLGYAGRHVIACACA